MNLRKTIFLDLDGTLFVHSNDISSHTKDPVLLPGTLEKLNEWAAKEYVIIITTGRKESTRPWLELKLRELGITYDCLIMGLPRGPRVVINDRKPSNLNEDTAIACCLERNLGIGHIDTI